MNGRSRLGSRFGRIFDYSPKVRHIEITVTTNEQIAKRGGGGGGGGERERAKGRRTRRFKIITKTKEVPALGQKRNGQKFVAKRVNVLL